MAKQSGRRGRARPRTLRKAGYVLLAMGLVVVGLALWATSTQLERAVNGLLLIGGALTLIGGGLMGLDWMGSYTAAAEGSWDHHVGSSTALALRRSSTSLREADGSHRRGRRMRLFAPSQQAAESAVSAVPQVRETVPPQPAPASRAVDLEPIVVNPVSVGLDEGVAPLAFAPAAPAAASMAPAAARDLSPDTLKSRPEPIEEPARNYRHDPGPDTVIEEFVGYEGQDRMIAAREPAPQAPRELAWPHPPRKAVDVSADGNEAFLEKLMDDVLARIGTHASAAPAASALAVGGAAPDIGAVAPLPITSPALAPPPPPPVWSAQTLHGADHWRFAALVEKLYQQAGFATQLQAGQTLGGVVVLWLFSRHRPGMPASVVRCVHAPGRALPAEEILSLAELVKVRGLPRGQLATTATVNVAGQQLAAAQQVHLMDTQRLLELITRRTAEQQRALAGRLA